MANTYSKIYIHVVFAVESRLNLIRSNIKEELYKFITGIVRNEKQKLIVINGMPDHIHMLIGLKPDKSLSDLVGTVKANSSRFINEKGWFSGKFNWQAGFGAFSYSHSQLDTVCRYIRNQEAHHSRETFKTEYLKLLKRFDISFEEKYLFQWIDDSGF